jgi:hypothetical protein
LLRALQPPRGESSQSFRITLSCNIAFPLWPTMLLITEPSFTLAVSSRRPMRLITRLRSPCRCVRRRVNSRNSRVGFGGTKLPRRRPVADTRKCVHCPHNRFTLPGNARTSCGFTSSRSNFHLVDSSGERRQSAVPTHKLWGKASGSRSPAGTEAPDRLRPPVTLATAPLYARSERVSSPAAAPAMARSPGPLLWNQPGSNAVGTIDI